MMQAVQVMQMMQMMQATCQSATPMASMSPGFGTPMANNTQDPQMIERMKVAMLKQTLLRAIAGL